MNITITIDDKEFEEAVSAGLKDVSKEQMNTIVVSALTEYMSKTSVLDELLFTKSGFYSSTKVPSDLAKSAIQNAIKDNEEIKQLGNLIVHYLKENHKAILMDAMVAAFMKNLTTDEFINCLRMSFSSIITKLNNPGSDDNPTIFF